MLGLCESESDLPDVIDVAIASDEGVAKDPRRPEATTEVHLEKHKTKQTNREESNHAPTGVVHDVVLVREGVLVGSDGDRDVRWRGAARDGVL